ncbi:MAG: MerR family transcriptional regulator [Polyangiaceae bacterium]
MDDRKSSLLLNRKDVAQQLRITYSKLRYYHDLGLIRHAKTGPRGAFLFTQDEVDQFRKRLASKRGGEAVPAAPSRGVGRIHAAAYELFAEGADHRRVTRELKIPAPDARHLEALYHERGVHFDEPSLHAFDRLLAVGGHEVDWRDPAAVAALLEHLVDAEMERDRLRFEAAQRDRKRPPSRTRIASSADSAAKNKSS